MPDTRPDTEFHDGECSACVNFRNRATIDWSARHTQLEEIVATLAPNAQGFTCIVPSSGGKDSTAQVIKLLELGAKPLVVTASTCMLTPIGRDNIENLKRFATTIEVTPNTVVRAKLNRFGLETVGDISYPEHMAIFSIPFQVAAMTGIKTIFYGECPQREYGCPAGAEEALTMTRRWVHEFGGFLGLRGADCVGYDGIGDRDMYDYLLPSDDALSRVTAFFLGQFIPWDSRRNAQVAISNGFKAVLPHHSCWWPAENLDNAMTGLHDHFCYRKYGYGRLCSQLSVDIRNGLIARDDAMDLVRNRDGSFPFEYAGVSLVRVLAKIGMTEEQLLKALDQFTDWSLFTETNNTQLSRPVLHEFARGPGNMPLHGGSDLSCIQSGELPSA